MSLAQAGRIAGRELRGGLRGFRIFLLCLALGVMAIAAIGTVRSAITAGLDREGAALLGGDAEMRYAYRYATPEERAWMETNARQVSETTDFRSMVTIGEGADAERGLTQVQGVDAAYPLIGEVSLEPVMPLAEAFAGDGIHPGAVIERVLADRLGLASGDTFRLGTQTFVLSAILERYPDSGAGSFGLGPRTLVLNEDLAASGLLSEGSLFETNYRLDFADGADLTALEEAAQTAFPASGLRWQDAREGAGGITRFVDRLGSFLVLIGLSGLAVGGVGISAAVRAYLSGKSSVIATLKTLGATRATIFQTYALQIGALTVLGIAIGLVLGAFIPMLLAPWIEDQLPVPAEFRIYPLPLIEAAIYGVLATAIFTLWPLARAQDIRAATLFRDAFDGGRRLPRWPYIAIMLVLLGALVGAAIFFTGTWQLSLATAGGIAGALLLLSFAALFMRWLARRAKPLTRGRIGARLALASIGARGGETTSVILSLGLGLSVLAGIGQIDGNIQRAITEELPDVAPSYFFLDIQPDQIDGYAARLNGDAEVSRFDAAPMLRGVISQINGKPASEVTDHWVIRGDRGVTYSAEVPENTVITEGAWWAADHTGPPEISFSDEEAREMGLSLGDSLTVNILGRDITGVVTSFRQVDFSTGGMGFVMSMSPNALAGAPHTWISTVYASEEAEAPILRDLANAYPNITAIRVRDAIDQVRVLIDGIGTATRYGALATLVTGVLVLIGAAAAGERARTYEAAVLKTLGASRARILFSFALRSALAGAVAGIVALVAGIAGSWAVTVFVMESDFAVIWSNAILIILGGAAATLLAGLAFAWRPLAAKPAQVLRARE